MSWLPFEDKIAGASEKLVLKYNPNWSGAGETLRPVDIPDCYREKFEPVYHEEFLLNVPFTRESWNGRMKACRGVGASLSEEGLDGGKRSIKGFSRRMRRKNLIFYIMARLHSFAGIRGVDGSGRYGVSA